MQLASAAVLIGVDQSSDRLSTEKGELPPDLCLIRADLVDFTSACWQRRGMSWSAFCLCFTANPWPKIGHPPVATAGTGTRYSPVLAQLGPHRCHGNWRIYVEEFAFALGRVLGREVP